MVEQLDEVLELTRAEDLLLPVSNALADWVAAHPLEASAHHRTWESMLAVIAWVVEQRDGGNRRDPCDVRVRPSELTSRQPRIASKYGVDDS